MPERANGQEAGAAASLRGSLTPVHEPDCVDGLVPDVREPVRARALEADRVAGPELVDGEADRDLEAAGEDVSVLVATVAQQ